MDFSRTDDMDKAFRLSGSDKFEQMRGILNETAKELEASTVVTDEK